MLVLTRCVGEAIVIGNAVVKIVAVSGGKVKLGVDTPPGVRVRRAELPPLPDSPAPPAPDPRVTAALENGDG